MKVGETVPVSIDGHEVARATVKEINNDVATLVIPATILTAQVKTQLDLTPDPAAQVELETQSVLLTDAVEAKPTTLAPETPGDSVSPQEAATQQVPGVTPTPAQQPDAVPTPEQTPVAPEVPQEVQDAVEQEATQ